MNDRTRLNLSNDKEDEMKKYFQKYALVAALAAVITALVFSGPAFAAYSVVKSYSRISAVAGETLATGNVVCIKSADGYAYKADADDSTARPAVGIIGKGGASGATVEIITEGILGGWSSLTKGAPGYLSATAGAVTQTKVAAYHQKIAVAISATQYRFSFGSELANLVRYYDLPLMGFVQSNGSALSSSSAPGIEIDNVLPNVVWSDGEATPIMISFRVPNDYASGGAFKVLATESDSTTPNEIDFDVYVNKDGQAADAAATGQTPVALAGTTSTPDEVTLTVATDFDNLAAGDWVTLRIWRDDTATGTGDLEVKGVTFYYNAKQQ